MPGNHGTTDQDLNKVMMLEKFVRTVSSREGIVLGFGKHMPSDALNVNHRNGTLNLCSPVNCFTSFIQFTLSKYCGGIIYNLFNIIVWELNRIIYVLCLTQCLVHNKNLINTEYLVLPESNRKLVSLWSLFRLCAQ